MRKSKCSISLSQLASELNLSPGTISIVLNGRGNEMRISKSTQEKVIEAARKYGYESNIYAKQPYSRDGETQQPSVMVLIPYIKGVKNVLGGIIYGIQSAILNQNLSAAIIMQPYYSGKLCDMKKLFSSCYCNGVIACGMSEDDVSFLLKEDFDIPVVLFNRATEKYSSVYVEDYEAGKRVATLLNSHGHKNVGLIMPVSRNKAGSMRQLGFLDGCRNLGQNILPYHIQEDTLSAEGGYRAAKRLLEKSDRPTALFVQISEMAAGAVNAIKEKGIKIPDDMELITYGDSQFEEFMTPSLTTVHMPVEAIASGCLQLVLDLIKSGDSRPVSHIQPLNMIFRESCAGFPK